MFQRIVNGETTMNIKNNIPVPEKPKLKRPASWRDNVSASVTESNKRRTSTAKMLAVEAGLNKYNTGKACLKGHFADRYVANNQCVQCSNEKTSRQKAAKPEHFKRLAKLNWIRHAYGLTESDFESMVAGQNNKCAICSTSLDDAVHIDHCHTTGKVRGLLCPLCNKGLGHFRDSPELLNNAAIYLCSQKQ